MKDYSEYTHDARNLLEDVAEMMRELIDLRIEGVDNFRAEQVAKISSLSIKLLLEIDERVGKETK